MNAAWLILDSLSFSATPFAPDGPNTMPQLKQLADDHAVVFNNSFVPGPSSPSSHGSFFTGERPSTTGMHEAYPYFEGGYETIGEAMGETHESLLASSNVYLFNGLDRGFDTTHNVVKQEYLRFPAATDPREFIDRDSYDGGLTGKLKLLLDGGKPFRNFVNAYQFWKKQSRTDFTLPERTDADSQIFQYASTLNAIISDFVSAGDDSFVVANYMDIHPPLDASDEALDRFLPDTPREDLPIGVGGQEILERIHREEDYTGQEMYDLLKARIWDTDQLIAPLVQELLDEGTFVVVTADHGSWFRRQRELEEERIHVPLLIFSPEEAPRTVDETVNIRHLPETTMQAVRGESGCFPGTSLLDVSSDQTSVTEFIYNPQKSGKPVNPHGTEPELIRYDLAALKGNTWVESRDGRFDIVSDGPHSEELEDVVTELRAKNREFGGRGTIEYDEETRKRLEDFGYL